jgi:hypothetical protein
LPALGAGRAAERRVEAHPRRTDVGDPAPAAFVTVPEMDPPGASSKSRPVTDAPAAIENDSASLRSVGLQNPGEQRTSGKASWRFPCIPLVTT